ncbi:MAG TPA: hypothetical protein VFZ12_01580 [Dehalococcoidia bacterium]|nr:hypothetical protein [Dehalococcoidia bacterium]
MILQLLSGLIVVGLALGSACLAGLPGFAALRSSSTQRAVHFAGLGFVPLVFAVVLIYVTASAGFPPVAAVATLVAAGMLAACSLVVYRRTPEVDRFDKLVLALLGGLLFAPLSLLLFGTARVLDALSPVQLLVGSAIALLTIGVPAAVVFGYGAILERVREPEPIQVRRIESSQRRMAEAAARQLLRDVMGDDVTRQAATKGYLEVEGKLCRYRVYPGSFRTAVLNKSGRWIGNLCVIPANSQPVPDYDQLLAKVLMLQHAEEEFWVTANLIDSGPQAWEIRDRLAGEAPVSRRNRVEPSCP